MAMPSSAYLLIAAGEDVAISHNTRFSEVLRLHGTLQIFICKKVLWILQNLFSAKKGGPLKLAALCGRIARAVQRPALWIVTT